MLIIMTMIIMRIVIPIIMMVIQYRAMVQYQNHYYHYHVKNNHDHNAIANDNIYCYRLLPSLFYYRYQQYL